MNHEKQEVFRIVAAAIKEERAHWDATFTEERSRGALAALENLYYRITDNQAIPFSGGKERGEFAAACGF